MLRNIYGGKYIAQYCKTLGSIYLNIYILYIYIEEDQKYWSFSGNQ